MKKTISLILIVCFAILSLSFSVSAYDMSKKYSEISLKSSLSKAQFAEHSKRKYEEKASHEELSDQEISNLLLLLRKTDDSKYEEELNNAGIYIYSSATSYFNIQGNERTSEPSDVIMNTCEILHNTTKNQWEIRFVGTWESISPISDEVHVWFNPTVGATMHVGGYDAVGIVLYDTSGNSPTKLDSSATLRSSDGVTSSTNTNPDTADDSYGVGFSIQDYIICRSKSSPFTYTWDYVGATFEAKMVFDASFANYHGKAKGHYTHTWKSASVTSVGAGWPSFEMSWVPENYAFGCYSNTAAEF